MKIAVIGSRDFTDRRYVFNELDQFKKVLHFDEIVSGGAEGVDQIAKEYAKERKLKYTEFPADWKDMTEPCVRKVGRHGEYNALSGIKRNTLIVEYCDKLIAFHKNGSDGTGDAIKKADKAGKLFKAIKL